METRYPLTENQINTIRQQEILFQQAMDVEKQAREQINFWQQKMNEAASVQGTVRSFLTTFLQYLAVEMKLPPSPGGYRLSDDSTCLIGSAPEPAEQPTPPTKAQSDPAQNPDKAQHNSGGPKRDKRNKKP